MEKAYLVGGGGGGGGVQWDLERPPRLTHDVSILFIYLDPPIFEIPKPDLVLLYSSSYFWLSLMKRLTY